MFKQDFWYSLFWGHWGFPKEVKGSKITVWYVLNTILHTYIMLKHPMYKLFTTYSTSWAWISINILLIFLYKNTLESAFTVSVAALPNCIGIYDTISMVIPCELGIIVNGIIHEG